jgi:protein-histidine pros-kinase
MLLRTKFNLVILAACAVGFVIAAILLDYVTRDSAREQVLQNARIMMSAANAIRGYTASHLVPLLPQERDGQFVPETVPAFAAVTNFKALQTAFAGFSYREAALNPTNLTNRAHDWEADIIHTFRDEPIREEIVIERLTPAGPLLHVARPIAVRTETCLSCHSTPSSAPAALIRTYGSTNGFGWKLHETIGAQILTVPMAIPLQIARQTYVTFLIILAAIFAVVFVVINLLLHYHVIRPVKRVSAMAEAASLGDEDVEVYIKPGKDEISSLSIAFNRMRESLKHAMDLLK